MCISNIQEQLTSLGYETKKLSSKRIAILTNESRTETLKHCADVFNGIYDPTNSDSSSSIGWVEVSDTRIYAKPKSKQGSKSAGIENELTLINIINEKKPSRIIFTDGDNQYTIDNVQCAKDVGRITTGRRKADVVIQADVDVPISIKKDNAEMWESVDKLCGDLMFKYVKEAEANNQVQLEPYNKVSKLSSSIAVKCTTEIAESVMFGSDIKNSGVILFRSFSEKDFTLTKDELTIQVSHIISSLDDVSGTKHEPWLLFRNDSTRTSTAIPGIRALAVTRSRIKDNTIIMG